MNFCRYFKNCPIHEIFRDLIQIIFFLTSKDFHTNMERVWVGRRIRSTIQKASMKQFELCSLLIYAQKINKFFILEENLQNLYQTREGFSYFPQNKRPSRN